MNEMKNPICPSCGSTKIKIDREQKQINLPFSNGVSYEATIDHCLECDFAGDFANENDKNLELALGEAKKDSVSVMLAHLTEHEGYTMAGMERALELPARTMMQWKTAGLSAGALALLRIVATYPFTIDVADHAFDRAYANSRLVEESFSVMRNFAHANNIDTKINVVSASPYETFGTFQIRTAMRPAVNASPATSAGVTVTVG